MRQEVREALSRLDSILAQLGERLAPAVDVLRRAHESGPKALAFDEVRARRWMETTARFYFIREIDLSNPAPTGAERVRRYRELEESLKDAFRELDAVINDPELSNDFLSAWWEQFEGEADQFFHIESEARGMFGGITQLSVAAHIAAIRVEMGPGAPKTSSIPKSLILNLAGGYEEATGLKPTQSATGQFNRFVCAFMEALGKLREENTTDLRRKPVAGLVAEATIEDAIKDALRGSRAAPDLAEPSSGQPRPQPRRK